MADITDEERTPKNEGGNRKKPSSKNKKPLVLILLILVIIAIGVGAWVIIKDEGAGTPDLHVSKMPPASGVNLILPNKDPYGKDLPKPCYDGAEIVNNEAKKKYDPSKCNEIASELVIPIVGDCPIETNGVIGAPSDYTKGCSFKHKNGGMAYLGHSVKGPRVGAFERTYNLKPGDRITVDNREFEVALVSHFPTTKLPNRLWKPNRFSLITCFIDAAADAGGEITTDVVIELKEV